MRRPRLLLPALVAIALAASAALVAAAERTVAAMPGALAEAVAGAQPGDVLFLAPGRYHGPVLLEIPLTLDGGGEAIIEGGGAGSVITVTGQDVTVRGLEIRGSGSRHEEIDAAIKLSPIYRAPGR